jgi:hypothetical protein
MRARFLSSGLAAPPRCSSMILFAPHHWRFRNVGPLAGGASSSIKIPARRNLEAPSHLLEPDGLGPVLSQTTHFCARPKQIPQYRQSA